MSLDESPEPARDGFAVDRRAIEAVLMVASDPVPASVLAELSEIPVESVESACERMSEDYERELRGFVLQRVAGGYRFQSHPEVSEYVERFARETPAPKLSAAALETLAIIAYRQPVTRAQISEIRGVSGDGVVRLLAQRGYVEAVGKAIGPGQAVLYATTRYFLERMGINSIEDLYPAGDLLPSIEAFDALEEELRAVGGLGSRRVSARTDAPVGIPDDGGSRGGSGESDSSRG